MKKLTLLALFLSAVCVGNAQVTSKALERALLTQAEAVGRDLALAPAITRTMVAATLKPTVQGTVPTVTEVLNKYGGFHFYNKGTYYLMGPEGWAEILDGRPEHFIRPSEVISNYIKEHGIQSVRLNPELKLPGIHPELRSPYSSKTQTVRDVPSLLEGKRFTVYNYEEGQHYLVGENGELTLLSDSEAHSFPTGGEAINKALSDGTLVFKGVKPRTGMTLSTPTGKDAPLYEKMLRSVYEFPIYDAQGKQIATHLPGGKLEYTWPEKRSMPQSSSTNATYEEVF